MVLNRFAEVQTCWGVWFFYCGEVRNYICQLHLKEKTEVATVLRGLKGAVLGVVKRATALEAPLKDLDPMDSFKSPCPYPYVEKGMGSPSAE